MRVSQLGSGRLLRVGAGGVGVVAAGVGSVQTSDAAIVYQAVDAPVPQTYGVDFDGDTVVEFNIAEYDTVTKVADIAPTTAFVEDGVDGRAANLALGTLIGPDSPFGTDGAAPVGGDPLNGTIETAPMSGEFVPAGHFQPDDPSGFIGVRFGIGGSTHYGYVGYEGVGDPNDPTGHVFALGYEDTPNTAIEAGAGAAAGVPGDYNENGAIDAADYTVWRDTLGATSLPNEGPDISPGAVDQADYDFWKERFGAASGASAGIGVSSSSSVPEPASLCLLAAGAVGLPLYRRRRSG